MSTQYDKIGASFEQMKKLPIDLLQDANVKSAIAPFIQDAHILDLACGTGHFSRKFLDWGAKSVVGVDISTAMVDAARNLSASKNLSFQVADASLPRTYISGPFDVVFGSWLLNYAKNGHVMANMYRNIELNLRDGGHFIGVTPHPTEQPRAHLEKALEVRPLQYGGIVVYPKNDIEDGVETHLEAATEPKIEFDGYYLRKSVWEAAAKAGGLNKGLDWREVVVPDELGGNKDSSWDTYLTVPHFAILVAAKD